MPLTEVIVQENQIFRCRRQGENCESREAVSNFSLQVLQSVHVESDAGGSRLLLAIRKYPNDVKQ